MKTLMHVGIWLAIVWPCAGEQVLREFDWRNVSAANELRGGEVLELDGRAVLKISNTNDSPLQLNLLTIESPGVSKFVYALAGEIKYEGAQGAGYLEMWNSYPPAKPGMPEERFFSRTLAEGGKMGRISGTSNWRKFMVPFDRTGNANPPVRLEFNVFLPGRGTVFLGPVKLVEYEGKGIYAINSKAGWWGPRTAGALGAIIGVVFGVWGSIVGLLMGMGKGRSFVVSTMRFWSILGYALGVAGLIALTLRQPYEVWFLLVLPAIVLVAVSRRSLKDCQRRYEELELRKMTAADACDR